jgi:hypothetical protein
MKKMELRIEVNRDKAIGIQLSLLRIDDENPNDLIETYHRMTLRPGDNIAAIRAANEAHLAMPYAQSGIQGAPWPKIPDAEWAEVEAIVALMHTPEVVAERRRVDAANAINATMATP